MKSTGITAVDLIKKTLLNYDLTITNVHTELTKVQATLSRYKGYKSKRMQHLYEMNYWEEKRLLKYLDALREGQQNCKKRIQELLEIYYPIEEYRKVWYLHFIEEKTDDEIAEQITFQPNYIRRLVVSFKKDLIELGFKTCENLL